MHPSAATETILKQAELIAGEIAAGKQATDRRWQDPRNYRKRLNVYLQRTGKKAP